MFFPLSWFYMTDRGDALERRMNFCVGAAIGKRFGGEFQSTRAFTIKPWRAWATAVLRPNGQPRKIADFPAATEATLERWIGDRPRRCFDTASNHVATYGLIWSRDGKDFCDRHFAKRRNLRETWQRFGFENSRDDDSKWSSDSPSVWLRDETSPIETELAARVLTSARRSLLEACCDSSRMKALVDDAS